MTDLEGQGDSPLAPDCGTNMLQRHADDLLAVIDRLSPGAPCGVFGHSGGGLAAVIAEAQASGSFHAMYLYEPVVFGPASTADDRRGLVHCLHALQWAHMTAMPGCAGTPTASWMRAGYRPCAERMTRRRSWPG